jgi:hypothetical protein
VDLLDSLSSRYGNPADPGWNLRVRPLLEEAASLVRVLGAHDTVLADASARLLLGERPLLEAALEAAATLSSRAFPLLAEPSRAHVDTSPFSDPERFLTPDATALRPALLARVAGLLGKDPATLLPCPAPEPELSARARFALGVVTERLTHLDPRAPLERLEVLVDSPRAVVLRPHYTSSWLVFGGAHYLVGPDGGVLVAAPTGSLEEVLAAYEDGVRSEDLDPASSDEVWARNCGASARAIERTLHGHRTSARGVRGHWEKGHFVDGELLGDMLFALDLAQPTTVDHAELSDIVARIPSGSSLVVGVKWKDWNRGHWFNVLSDAGRPVWVNGQDGTSGSWPPPMLERFEPWALVLRPKR